MIGSQPLEIIHRGERATIYRAPQGAEHPLRVLKTLHDPSHAQTKLQREHEILTALAGVQGVVRSHGITRLDGARGQPALALAYFAGRSLQALGSVEALSLVRALDLTSELLAVLQQVHMRGIVHGDLCPSNVLVRSDGELCLIDFASAFRSDTDTPRGSRTRRPHSVAYAAPEQTGRLSRTVDRRSDLYSLGVMLFELVTGSLPFRVSDVLELAHAHIARPPPRPRDLAPELPPALSDLILRLLAKEPEGRYASAEAVRRDVLHCRDAILRGQTDCTTLPSAPDSIGTFISDRLYGRGANLAQLEDAIDRAFRGCSTAIALEGPAGIGKTALANELRRAVSLRKGFWLSGKYDADPSIDPLRPLRDALLSLAEQLDAWAGDRLRWLPVKLEARLPGATRALLAFCPGLGMLLGEPSDDIEREGAVDLLPRAAGELLRLVSGGGHPVCLFLDDLQWATASSLLALREMLACCRLGSFVFVVAYRHGEPAAERRCRDLLAELEQQSFALLEQDLGALAQPEIRALVADSFQVEGERLATLSEFVCRHSGGNPLFARTLLHTLRRECTVQTPEGWFDLDLSRMHSFDPGHDVVDLLSRRTRELPSSTIEALKYAAILGRHFDRRVLQGLLPGDVNQALAPAVHTGILVAFDDFSPAGGEPWSSGEPGATRFSHDRALQAVLALVEPQEAAAIHLRAGRFLWRELTASGRSPHLLETVSHLNRAADLLSAEERLGLARLNLEAARGAMQSGHGELALSLVRYGIEDLGQHAFTAHEELARDLVRAQAEAAFGWADHELLTASCELLRTHARTAQHRVEVLVMEGRLHQSQQRSGDAIRTYLRALAEVDVELPLEPDAASMGQELRLTAEALRIHGSEAILGLPECTDPHVVTVMALLSKLVFFSYAASNALLTVAACRMVRLSLTHGPSPESANGYAFYGLIVARDHDLDRAVQFARLALDLAERCGSAAVLSNAHLHANYQLMHWKVPLKHLPSAFLKAYHYGLQAGSPTNASCAATTLCICKFWSGHDLTQLMTELDEYRAQLLRFKQRLVLNWHEILMQTVHNLRQSNAAPHSLSGPYYEERERLPVHVSGSDTSALFNYYMAKALLCILFEDHSGAIAAVESNAPYAVLYGTSMWAVPCLFLDTLARLEICLRQESQRARHIPRIDENLAKLRAWCAHNPEAVEHRLRTLEALRAWLDDRPQQAGLLFSEATELARQAGPHDEALSCELAGRFWLGRGDMREARACMRRAHRAYFVWGAIAKARTLEARYAALLAPATWRGAEFDARLERAEELDTLDLVGVLSASRAIAGEIRLEALLERLMALLIETAGAEVGYLVLPRDDEWVVEAGVNPDGTHVATLRSIRADDLARHGYRPLRQDALEFVIRTAEPVLLEDPAEPSVGGHVQVSRGSVLCFPFKRQGGIEAIAYLENRLVRNVFTRSAVAVLEVLSGQAVIALQNARLYQELEQRVLSRTQELRQRNQDLQQAMGQLVELQQLLVMKEKLAALGALTASISHEIKNPLNFVTNFAEVAEGLALEIVEQAQDARAETTRALAAQLCTVVQKVSEHGRRAASIVDSMALHSPHGPLLDPAKDLNALVQRSVEMVPHDADVTRWVVLDLGADIAPVALNDQSFARVIVNLLSNALYSVRAKLKSAVEFAPRIVVSTRDTGEYVELRVWDNGQGIPPELHEKIFLPFFTSKALGQGTGLGLSISYDVVVRGHGGSISVASTVGEFAEFTVRLPRGERSAARPAVRSASTFS